jgi:hypothetical protein
VQKKIHILCGSAKYFGTDEYIIHELTTMISSVSVIRTNSAIHGLFMHSGPVRYTTSAYIFGWTYP